MILLWGLTGDSPFNAVRAVLERCKAPVTLIDQRNELDTSMELSLDSRLEATITSQGIRHSLEDVTAAYWRPHDLRSLPAVLAASSPADAIRCVERFEGAMALWLEMTNARVVNRPSDMASNGSKPYQLELIRAQGFDVPATLISTDPAAILRFWTDSGAVIYKSVSGVRSIVARLTNAHLERLENVVWCPTQFQQFVPGRDYRVHVVGDDVFACEIICEADDYRYAASHGAPAEVRSTRVPDDVAGRCVALSRSLGLHLAGIDLRRAPDDRWFCFEVNPSPGFTYYESHTGQPIAAAIASYLAS